MLERHSENPALRFAIRAALTGGSIAASLGAAQAQTVAASASPDSSLQEVVVTGSRIALPNDVAIAPVTSVSAVEIERTGVTRVEDLLNQLPQVFAGQNANTANASDGTASINLRGLGEKRTLTLVNGQRLGPGDPTTGGQSDINMIPIEMVDSIEVLTGGASSTYGADAVAGVVNFKLNDHFEGVKIVADAGIYQNHNSNVEGVEDAERAAGDAVPSNNVWAGAQRSIAVIMGMNSPDGNGNATFYATYRNVLPVVGSQYSTGACTLGSGHLNSANGAFQCAGSATAYPTNYLNGTTGTFYATQPNGTVSAANGPNTYNYGALNYFQRNDERYTAGAFLHYDFNEHVGVYSHFMFMDDQTSAQIAGSGDFAANAQFNCSNPLLTPGALGVLCGGSTAGLTNPNVYIFRRNVEGGGRVQSIEHMDIHEVLGVKGKIDDAWSYDASFNWSLVNLNSQAENYFSESKLNNALNVTGTAANPVCVSGGTCVPYNPFAPGGVTQAQLNYLYAPGILTGRVEQKDVIVNLTGDLGQYGLKLPTANSGLKVNLGGEYRDQRLATNPDEESQTGDLEGSGGDTLPVSGGLIAREGFVEANLPILEDLPGAHRLDADAGYRYSSYSEGFKTNTFNLGLEWAPIQDVRLRGSFARAVRAPNIIELFSTSAVGLDGTYAADPCSGTAPTFTAAQCARTGVTAAEYGKIVANPAGQYNGLLGGNTALQPETAITKSFGVGYQPSWLPNFRVQVDYYDINVENVIQQIGGSNILNQCANNGVLCNLINRNATGSLWSTTAGYISDTLVNVGDLEERGVDLDMSYGYDLGAFGKVSAQMAGTWVGDYNVTPISASPGTKYNCSGLMGPICSSPDSGAGTPVFKWRHRFSTTWETPWQNLDITATWRYYSAVSLESLNGNPNLSAGPGNTVASGAVSNTDARFPSFSYIDLTAAVKLADKLTLRLGCNNVADKQPPLVGSTNIGAPPTGNNNTYPGVYDSLGRYFFGEITAQF